MKNLVDGNNNNNYYYYSIIILDNYIIAINYNNKIPYTPAWQDSMILLFSVSVLTHPPILFLFSFPCSLIVEHTIFELV